MSFAVIGFKFIGHLGSKGPSVCCEPESYRSRVRLAPPTHRRGCPPRSAGARVVRPAAWPGCPRAPGRQPAAALWSTRTARPFHVASLSRNLIGRDVTHQFSLCRQVIITHAVVCTVAYRRAVPESRAERADDAAALATCRQAQTGSPGAESGPRALAASGRSEGTANWASDAARAHR